MNFWERLAWITIAVALIVFVVLMGIKIIRLEEDIEETAQSLEGEKTELHNELVDGFYNIEEKVDEDIAGLAQYLEGEINNLYSNILNNYNMNKEYIDNKILVIEYLINRICEINGLELPAGYTPPEFEE